MDSLYEQTVTPFLRFIGQYDLKLQGIFLAVPVFAFLLWFSLAKPEYTLVNEDEQRKKED